MTDLPTSGPLPRPANPDEGRAALRDEAIPAPDTQRVRLRAVEFTSICPRSGQPDFGGVTIEYEPGELLIESRSLKFYLWSFRDEGAFCESLAARIADDIVAAIAPEWLRVDVHQNVRGGIEILARAQRGDIARPDMDHAPLRDQSPLD